jgi:hypothetical protein
MTTRFEVGDEVVIHAKVIDYTNACVKVAFDEDELWVLRRSVSRDMHIENHAVKPKTDQYIDLSIYSVDVDTGEVVRYPGINVAVESVFKRNPVVDDMLDAVERHIQCACDHGDFAPYDGRIWISREDMLSSEADLRILANVRDDVIEVAMSVVKYIRSEVKS